MEDAIRPRYLDGGQEVERGVGPHDGPAGDERPVRTGGHVDGVAFMVLQRRAERVEWARRKAEPVTRRMEPLRGSELRVTCNRVRDVSPDIYRRRHGRPEESRDDDCRCEGVQPNRRTVRRTRIALKPSRHVIFFPSA